MKEVFDSEFSHVKYIAEDNVVLLTWKKFCRFEDYRNPTMFASQLMKRHWSILEGSRTCKVKEVRLW